MVKRKVSYAQGFWTIRRTWYLTLVFMGVWLLVAYSVAPNLYGNFFGTPTIKANDSPTLPNHYALQIGTQPPISYKANITLSTVGTFAVGNYIHFNAAIYDVNISDFRSHFESIGFLHAGYGSNNGINPILPIFDQGNNGVWMVEGDFVFLTLVNATGPMLIPINNTTGATAINIPALYTDSVIRQIDAYNFPLCGTANANSYFCGFTLQPQDATTTLVNNEAIFHYTITLTFLGGVFFQPLFKGILVSQKDGGKSDED